MDGAFKLQPVATCESTLELDTRMLARVQQLIQSRELLLSAVNEEILCSRKPEFFLKCGWILTNDLGSWRLTIEEIVNLLLQMIILNEFELRYMLLFLRDAAVNFS